MAITSSTVAKNCRAGEILFRQGGAAAPPIFVLLIWAARQRRPRAHLNLLQSTYSLISTRLQPGE
jgi:hypothetical protein